MRNFKYLAIFAIALPLAMGSGCKKKNEENAQPAPAIKETKIEQSRVVEQTPVTENKEENVTVPENVKGKWKDVEIEVLNKQTNQKSVLAISIGSEAAIPGSSLKIRVENFLPEFSMDGANITSASNNPNNPAAQISVFEGGKEIFRGWLFALYSSTQFEHPGYNLTLAGYVPQGKKGKMGD